MPFRLGSVLEKVYFCLVQVFDNSIITLTDSEMNRQNLFRSAFLMVLMAVLSAPLAQSQTKTRVLVVGTIHDGHNTNPNYSYRHLADILGTFRPDAICVEIPPSYFRKRSYLIEMMYASIYGFDNGLKVYPIDWWSPGDARAERREYEKTDDYRKKEMKVDSLVEANEIMQQFRNKYGSMDSIWRQNTQDYRFFNGKDYNDYIREMYTILVDVFGDGCMNLYSEKRNAMMMDYINRAVDGHRGQRVIVFAGAEHKYYFDLALSEKADVALVTLDDILPLQPVQPTENMISLIEDGLAKGYYDTDDVYSVDVLYANALTPVLHGSGMDQDPSIVPAENIERAKPILAEWASQKPSSVRLAFDRCWLKFLEKDFQGAISLAESVADRLDDVPSESAWFVKSFFWRNLGFCYDLTGQRAKAVEAYRKCKSVCEELKMNPDYAKSIYADFENEPYRDKRN